MSKITKEKAELLELLPGWPEFLEVQEKRQQRMNDILDLISDRECMIAGIEGSIDDLGEEAIELAQQLVTDWMSCGWVGAPPKGWQWIEPCEDRLPDEVRLMLHSDDEETKTWSDLAYVIENHLLIQFQQDQG